MKVIIAGPEGVHILKYCEMMQRFNDLNRVGLTENPFENPFVTESFATPFRSSNPFRLLANYYSLKRYIKKVKPDIIHVHQLNRFAFVISVIAKKLSIPLVSTAWGSDVLLIPQKNMFYRQITKYILRNSACVTADSKQMIAAIHDVYPECKTEFCIYCIDIIGAGVKENIMFTNRLHKPLYRNSLIIDLFAKFIKNHPDWKLVIGGCGDETEMLKQKVADLNLNDKVIFTGWLEKEQNNEWYRIAKVYISLPDSDGTSISLLEAMSAGCVPVLPDIPVSYEWIKNGENGIICDLKNPSPFDDVLIIDFEKAAKLNSELILKSFTKEKSSVKFKSIYDSIIEK